MITLIGHGYIGEHVAQELSNLEIAFYWIKHNDPIPPHTVAIINAAGYTGSPNVDACELHRQETINGNVIFPVQLEIANPNIPIVHISSGCVYTGYVENGWTEEDSPNFDFNNGSFYSGSKALEQQLLTPYLNKSYLLRIRMPFGDEHHPKNFLTKLFKYEKLIDFENSLSYVYDVARVAVHFAINLPEPGIYNVCNAGSKTTKEMANMLNLNKQWFTNEEFLAATKAPRSNCVMNVDKLQKVCPIQDIDSALKKAVSKLKNI